MVAIISAVLMAVIVIAFFAWVFGPVKDHIPMRIQTKDILIFTLALSVFSLLIWLSGGFRWIFILLAVSYMRVHWLLIKFRNAPYSSLSKNSALLAWPFYIPSFILGFASHFICGWMWFGYATLYHIIRILKEQNDINIKGTDTSVASICEWSCISAAGSVFLYWIFKVWWFFLGDDYFNDGLFALADTPGDLFWYTIMLFVIILYFLSFFILKK